MSCDCSLVLPSPCGTDEGEAICHLRYNEYTLLHQVSAADGTEIAEDKQRVLFHIVCSGMPDLKTRNEKTISPWLGKIILMMTSKFLQHVLINRHYLCYFLHMCR